MTDYDKTIDADDRLTPREKEIIKREWSRGNNFPVLRTNHKKGCSSTEKKACDCGAGVKVE